MGLIQNERKCKRIVGKNEKKCVGNRREYDREQKRENKKKKRTQRMIKKKEI